MELQQLRYFIALSQERHFNRAAKRMHVTQPTLSQQIKKLETELGGALFERSPHAVRLTAAGERLLPHFVAILDRMNQAVSEMQSETGEVSGLVRLGAIPTIAPYLLPQVIVALKKAAPKLRLEVYEETTASLIDRLKDGKLDLGILALPVTDAGIVSRSLGRETFYAAVGRTHALASKKHLHLKELAREKILILQEGHCFADQALEYCKRSRHDAQVIFQGSSLTSVMNLACAGEGVTFVPAMALKGKLPPELKIIPFSKPEPAREIGIAWRVSAPLRESHRLLIKLVAAEIKSLHAPGKSA